MIEMGRGKILIHKIRQRLFIITPPIGEATDPENICKITAGFCEADGFAGYNQLYREGSDKGEITEVAWQGRMPRIQYGRKIFEVWERTESPAAAKALKLIKKLYAKEDEIREKSPEERLKGREQSKLVVEAFFALASDVLSKISKHNALAKAFLYALTRQKALSQFLNAYIWVGSRLEIDNNFAENCIRPIAVGRKNYLFMGSGA